MRGSVDRFGKRQSVLLALMACWCLYLGGCATNPLTPAEQRSTSLPRGNAFDVDRSQLTEAQLAWLEKINAFHFADIAQTKEPYVRSINQLEAWQQSRYCSSQHKEQIEQALSLNPSSILAYSIQLLCAKRQGDEQVYKSSLDAILGISEILLLSGDGSSPQSAIYIRDPYEAQTMLQWMGIDIFGVELLRLQQRTLYLLHGYSVAEQKYVSLYADNTSYFLQNLQGTEAELATPEQIAELQALALLRQNSSTAQHWQIKHLVRNNRTEQVVQQLGEQFPLSPLLTVELGLALLQDKKLADFEDIFDGILQLSENGFVDASAVLGLYLLLGQNDTEVTDAANLFIVNTQQQSIPLATTRWLNSFLSMQKPNEVFGPFIHSLGEKYFQTWREHIIRFPRRFAAVTHVEQQKLASMLDALGQAGSDQAALDYALLMISGEWGQQHDSAEGLARIKALAEKGFSPAQLELGLFYSEGRHGLAVDPVTAFSLYTQSAQQGNPSALYNLGLAYRYGRGTTKDLELSVQKFRSAWEDGFALAGCRLADLYSEEADRKDMQQAAIIYTKVINDPSTGKNAKGQCAFGLGFLQYYSLAEKQLGEQNLKKAADWGNKSALFELGIIYSDAQNHQHNLSTAAEYYRRAVEQGSYRAAANLGYMYETGKGTIKDTRTALEYYRFAASGNSAIGTNNLATFLRYGIETPVDKAQAEALYLKAFEQGSEYAADNLADMYYYGELGEINHQKACDLYEAALQRRLLNALYDVAYCYLYGEGRPQDVDKGLELLQRSAELDNRDAITEMGEIYHTGRFVPQDINKALEYLHTAYQMQSSDAAFQLATLYATGRGVQTDPVLSKMYFEQSANWGLIEGMLATAKAYLQGFGTRKDKSRAEQWLQKAIEKGSIEAQKMLEALD